MIRRKGFAIAYGLIPAIAALAVKNASAYALPYTRAPPNGACEYGRRGIQVAADKLYYFSFQFGG